MSNVCEQDNISLLLQNNWNIIRNHQNTYCIILV